MSCLCAALLAAFPVSAQQALSTDGFRGWESWPLYHPGDLALDNARLEPMHLAFDALFPGPQGFGRGPLEPMTMYMDVFDAFFHGKAALWIQWTSSSPPAREDAAPAIDALLVDRATFRYLFRIGRSGPVDKWAGRYEIVHARPDGVTQTTVNDDGTTATKTLEGPANYFDFATYQFLLPFLDLHEGMQFRLAGYEYIDKAEEILPVRVVGRTRISDAAGQAHDVWQVDVMPAHGLLLITFYVSRAPPYFFGWDYRLTRDGRSAMKLTFRGWRSTAIN